MPYKYHTSQPPAPIRLERKIERLPESGCWIYMGCLTPDGYGKFMIDGKQLIAHRVSYMLNKGEIPAGLCVCHTCDVRCCVNPDHLWLGTVKENNQDKVNKGRAKGRPKSLKKLKQT